MAIDEATIEEVRTKTDIVEVISRSVQLKSAGRSLKGLCPFHSEKSPSFFVTRERQSFHCFGCGVGGNVFTFLMKSQGLSFVDTVEKLAAQAGVPIKKVGENDPFSQKREDLYRVNESASEWFAQQLLHPKLGGNCRAYLDKRGASKDTMSLFHLGFAPESWTDLTEHLQKKGFSEALLKETGLSIESPKNQSLYDRFRNRLIFPITNPQGRIVGFSGRTLKDDPMKYMNSPESLIFKKSQILFGIPQAKSEISKKNSVLLAEGHLDLCLLHQHGFANALAVQGTAFTEDHAQWISKYTKNLTVVFDGDNAGIKAALRVLPIALAQQLFCQTVSLPPGEDPASLLAAQGAKTFQKFLDQPSSLFEFKIQHLIQKKSLTPELKVSTVEALLEDLVFVQNPVMLDALIQVLSHATETKDESIRQQLSQKKHPAKPWMRKTQVLPERSASSFPPAPQKDLIRLLLSEAKSHASVFEKLDFQWITYSACLPLVDAVFKLHCDKQFKLETLLSQFSENKEILSWIEKESHFRYGENLGNAIQDVLKSLEKYSFKSKRDVLEKAMKIKEQNGEDILPLLSEIHRLDLKLKAL
jgi:DNA primase